MTDPAPPPPPSLVERERESRYRAERSLNDCRDRAIVLAELVVGLDAADELLVDDIHQEQLTDALLRYIAARTARERAYEEWHADLLPVLQAERYATTELATQSVGTAP